MQQLNVHGSIFYLLKKFIENKLPAGMWEKFNAEAGTADKSFVMTSNYPIEEINNIVSAASAETGMSRHTLQEQFGEYLVNDLFILYADYLQPEWRTFDVILHTEKVMHGAVRHLNSTASPPILHVDKVNDKLLIIDYHSKRKMAALAIGIIKGIANYYNETDMVVIKPMSDPDDERVQIRLEFL